MADEVESKNVEEKIEGKLVHKLSLSYTPPHYGAISWSCDDRISVVTDQCVYIMTLLFSEESGVKSNLKYHLSCVPAQEESFVIETGDVNNYDLGRMSCTNVTVKRLLDPAANPSKVSGVNFTAFTSVAWSPCGCDSYSRCIIATLCVDHRLSLCASNKIDKNWKEISCVSDIWHNKCKTIIKSDQKYKMMKKRKHHPQQSIPVSAITTKSLLEMEYVDTVAFAAIDWCPVLLDISKTANTDCTAEDTSSQKYALLVTTTKSGKIVFWKVAVPLSDGVADVQLAESDVQTTVQVPCSIAWYSTDGVKGLLAVGASNGQIEAFVIKISKQEESNITINCVSRHMLWNDCDDIAVNKLLWTYTSKGQSTFATLSASKGSAVVHFSVPYSEEENLKGSVRQIYDGSHSAFISGLDVGKDGRIFTCDSDSTLQVIDDGLKLISHEFNPSYSCNGIAVSPNGLYIAVLHTPSINRLQIDKRKHRQVEVSILSLFSEEFLNDVITQSSLGSLWDIQTAILQHYSQNVPPKEGPLMDFLNRPLDSIPAFSLYVRYRLVDQISKSSDSDSFNSEDAETDVCIVRDWKMETMETRQQIFRLFLTSSLKSWLLNYKECKLTEKARTSLLVMSDWLVMNYKDQASLDLAVQVYNMMGDLNSASLALSIRKESLQENVDDTLACNHERQEKAEKQVAGVVHLTQDGSPSSKTQDIVLENKNKSENKLPSGEKCIICQAYIPLTSLISGECPNGHAWKRCLATFCVCADYLYHRCQDCGGCISLIGQEQSPWLQKLLRETQVCPLCHGWKDSRG